MEAFCPEIGALTILHTLNMSSNRLNGALPPEVGLLRSLTSLDLSHNALVVLPHTLSGLTELQRLDLSHNQLQSLPRTVNKMDSLHTFDLGSNRLSRCLHELSQLSSLRRLDMSSNQIAYLPRGMLGWSQLDSLNLSRNALRALPPDLGDITKNVPAVIVSHNPLDDLPDKWNNAVFHSAHGAQNEAPYGYTDQQVLNWAKASHVFYDNAIAEWAATGALHYDGRSTYDLFVKAVRSQCGEEWQEGSRALLRRWYFEAKETGVFPKYYDIDEEEAREDERVNLVGQARRELRAVLAKRQQFDEALDRQECYHEELQWRLVGKRGKHLEAVTRRDRERGDAMRELMGEVAERVEQADFGDMERLHDREVEKYEEMQRLVGYVNQKTSKQWLLPDKQQVMNWKLPSSSSSSSA
mmetsp:Transcript_51896/g.70782  ORF Transcript_51896/g.70782 Transcript_51896/m.70782 type:complete len:411 (-) Transcript_51896:52-1284(-)